MREITYESIVSAVRDLCIEANCALPCDLKEAIAKAEQTEPSPVGRSILGDLVENYTFAGEKRLPICQDTGMAVVFCQLGQDAHITGGLLRDAVNEGVSKGYTEGFLRKSVVRDPIRRVNTLHRLTPSITQETIEDTIVRAVSEAGSNPCPPVVVGVGLGGDAELCAILAKKALLRPVDQHNEDPFYAEMEARILEKINRLGIGPQGLGGQTTALAVAINAYPTHIAGLPCCVNLGCHVTRHATKVL